MSRIADNIINQAVRKRLVAGITQMTVHNGPGIRSLIIFKGCPLRCVWCSTPESQNLEPEITVQAGRCTKCGNCVLDCPVDAISLTEEGAKIDRNKCNSCGECVKRCYPEAIRLVGQWMTVENIVKEVERDAIFYKHSGGGITISGGEPLLHPYFNKELLETCRKSGISVGVDTSGHVPWANIEQITQYVDFFLWDIKQMDPQKHREFTGVSNELILSNARAVSERGVPLYVRIPVIPGYNDSEENIRLTCAFASTLSTLVEVDLMPVHHLGRSRYKSLDRPYPIDRVSLIPEDVQHDMKRLVESYGLKCRIEG